MALKFCFQNDIALCPKAPQDFPALLEAITNVFRDRLPKNYYLQYEDIDGDRVCLACEDDYTMLKDNELKNIKKAIKIHVVAKDKQPEGEIDPVKPEANLEYKDSQEYKFDLIDSSVLQKRIADVLGESYPINILNEKDSNEMDIPEANLDDRYKDFERINFFESQMVIRSEDLLLKRNMYNLPENKNVLDANTAKIPEKIKVIKEEELTISPTGIKIDKKPIEQNITLNLVEKKPEKNNIQIYDSHDKKNLQQGPFEEIKVDEKNNKNPKIQEVDILKNAAISGNIKEFLGENLLNYIPTLAYLIKDFMDEDKRSNANMNIGLDIIHDNIQCNKCQMMPIKGIRYKCTTCVDFNLCQNCQKSERCMHNLIKIKVPIARKCPYNVDKNPFKIDLAKKCEFVNDTIKSLNELNAQDKATMMPTLQNLYQNLKEILEFKNKLEINMEIPANKPELDLNPNEEDYQAAFLRVTSMKPNNPNPLAIFKKVELMNTGKKSWPKDTYLKCFGPNPQNAENLVIDSISPGKRYTPVLKIIGKPGLNSMEWRVCYNDLTGKIHVISEPINIHFEIPQIPEEVKEKEPEIPNFLKKYSKEITDKAIQIMELFPTAERASVLEFTSQNSQKTIEELVEAYIQNNKG